MTDTAPTTTPDAAAPVVPAPAEPQGTDPIAPERTPETSATETPKVLTLTQEQLDDIIAKRLERSTKAAEKTLEERIAEIERTSSEQVRAAESTAINAIIARAAANAHDPAIVAKLVDLGELTSADAAGIEAKVAEFLTANPYLVKADAPTTPDRTPAPGVGVTGGGAKLLTAAECDALTVQQLQDADTLKLYLDSKAALGI